MVFKSNIFVPFFSIIIPIYNAEKYLNRCIASIKNQSFIDYEVILVDDGSLDSSAKICLEYAEKDDRFKYFKTENQGSFLARRFGINLVKGTYILFMDSDDFYATENTLSILYNELKDETVSAIQFGYLKQYNHLRRTKKNIFNAFTLEEQEFKKNEYPKLLCSFYDGSHLTTNLSNKAYHKSLFSNLPDFKNLKNFFMGDDLIMNLFILDKCLTFRFIPDILYCYQQGSGGTSKFSKSTMADLDLIKQYQLRFLEHYEYGNHERIEATLYSEVAGWFFEYIQNCIENLNDEETVDLIGKVLKYDSFKSARNYYLSKSMDTREAVKLLCKANPDEYLQRAKYIRRKLFLKRKIKYIFKFIYSYI